MMLRKKETTLIAVMVRGGVTLMMLLLLLYKGRCGQADEQQVVVGCLFRNGLRIVGDRCGRTGQRRIAVCHAAVGHTEQH